MTLDTQHGYENKDSTQIAAMARDSMKQVGRESETGTEMNIHTFLSSWSGIFFLCSMIRINWKAKSRNKESIGESVFNQFQPKTEQRRWNSHVCSFGRNNFPLHIGKFQNPLNCYIVVIVSINLFLFFKPKLQCAHHKML